MPVIRFVREGLDVECYPGENLREVALREGIKLYGLKGTLGNCGGCGQCITCFVEIPEANPSGALTPRTPVEEQKLRRRPHGWRLACQALVQQSLVVVTRPQIGLAEKDSAVATALAQPLPAGPTEWPRQPEADLDEADQEAEEEGGTATGGEGA
jgi:ferredoxin